MTEGEIQDVIRKAAVIEEGVKTEFWKLLMEVVGSIIERERASLATAKLDGGYLKKIGFLQAFAYFRELSNILKDRKVREYLLTQGRVSGLETAQKLPQYFFDGRQLGNEMARRQFAEAGDERKATAGKLEFLEKQLR